ncbi:hypothetical protein J437_LFUL003659, partial [Ladona fulva]
MISFKRDKKEEEEGSCNPFQNLEKTTVLQEARTFNETPVNPRKCTHILTKILYLLNQGEQLGSTEATEAFFAVTKLFQSKDVILRRMVYLGIKELSPIADDVIIVTSSLTRDMTGKEDLYRAAAIRALCSITDATMLQAIERYMKQAIVDRNPGVSSAALVSSLHLTKIAGDVVKRWVNEAQEAVNSDSVMVQYHALGVLYHIRKTDRLAVTKLVARLTRMILKSPYAVCMLIRIVCKLIEEESGNSGGDDGDDDDGGDEPSPSSPLFDFLESCLRHKSEMVVYEAAHAIVNVRRRGRRGGRSCNPFQNLEKTTVLQEARTFNETPVNPRKCTHILTKILYLLNQGEQLGSTEATEAFFAVTKLFQSKDVILRRMVYLGIKELSPIADDVIIVTSSLTRDMTGKEDLYRAAAIRALCSITDATMLQAIERYMKQAIVDRNPGVSSAALVSSLHLTKIAGDVVKRWVNEAQEAVNSD